MECIHIKSLEKYHPGYKDRTLQWAKIYINMADGDTEAEMIENEVDWARFVKMILLELRAQRPLPNKDSYWVRKGFDIKKRPISLTLQMLHNFIEIVTEMEETVTEPLRRVDKEKEEDKEKNKNNIYVDFEKSTLTNWNLFCDKNPTFSKIREISEKRRSYLKKRFLRDSFRGFDKILNAIKQQPFLTGENERKWVATFDWLIENDTNYLKVLELRYKNKSKDGDMKAADPDCQICAGTGWDQTGEGKTLCRCRLNR